jgi:hypothetical protein
LLNITIAQCHFTIRKLKEEKETLLDKISREISDDETTAAILDHIATTYEREFATTKDRQIRKFHHIKQRKALTIEEEEDIDKKRWVINISSHELSEKERDVLSKGLNFAVTPPKLPVEEFITSTELACQQLQDSTKSAALRSDVTRILSKRRKHRPNINVEERKALQSLSRMKDLKILPADKGRVTVLMNASDYDGKIKALLSDSNTYDKLRSDPTNKFKVKLIRLIKMWKENNKITQNIYFHLYPTAAETPKFYGLPKVHKNSNPLRPIVSSIGSITYEAAKILGKDSGPPGGKNSLPCEK